MKRLDLVVYQVLLKLLQAKPLQAESNLCDTSEWQQEGN